MNRLHGLHRLAMLSAFMALFTTGCCHNLQEPLVKAMEDTVVAIEADVEAGIYKPDVHSKRTIKRLKDATTDARAVLDSDTEE